MRTSAAEVREELSTATDETFSTGTLLRSRTLLTSSFEAMLIPPITCARSRRWYSMDGMIPRSALRARTASAQPAGVVYDSSNFPCSSPFSIPQISGTVLRYWTTETLGRGIGQQSRANSFYRKERECQLGLPIGGVRSLRCPISNSSLRVGLVVNFHQVFDGDLGVFLRGCEAFVAEHLLDGPEVGAFVEQVGSEGVAYGVRARLHV